MPNNSLDNQNLRFERYSFNTLSDKFVLWAIQIF